MNKYRLEFQLEDESGKTDFVEDFEANSYTEANFIAQKYVDKFEKHIIGPVTLRPTSQKQNL
ncbi:MAG TPA: hypothetical protein VF941_14260 [Clostridia bacterium]